MVSYADGDAYIANQRALVASGLNNCVNAHINYGPDDIDPVFFEKNRSILIQKKGAGYWLWKPYVILKTLEQVPENDFVLYVDTGALIIRPVDVLINHYLQNADMMLTELNHNIRAYTKRDLLKMMNMDNEKVLNAAQAAGTLLLMRNTSATKEFIKKWLEWCENEHALTDTPSSEKEYAEFVAHRHDQSILSLLSLQDSPNIAILPYEEKQKYFFGHRRRNKDHGSLAIPYPPFNNRWRRKITRDLKKQPLLSIEGESS